MNGNEKLVFISHKDGKAEVKEIGLGDEVMVNDLKFRITYLRQNPVRISLEPVPFKETGENIGNKVEEEVTAIQSKA